MKTNFFYFYDKVVCYDCNDEQPLYTKIFRDCLEKRGIDVDLAIGKEMAYWERVNKNDDDTKNNA